MKLPSFFLLVVTLMLVCHPQQNMSAQTPTPFTPSPMPIKLISLTTGNCKHYCPSYNLTFYTNGTMDFAGYGNVEKVGEQTIKLTADEFSKIQNEVRRANLWKYGADLPGSVADAPIHKFVVYDNGKIHTVKATSDLPKELMPLDQLMQDIAEQHGIKVKKGIDPNDPASATGEVIVKLRPGLDAESFCRQFMELKVRLLRQYSEDNVWLIGYNPSEITETNFIEMMHGMEGVQAVKPNVR